ncbi:MAG: cobyrinate a,c-diamide synthase [Firmicutes bacterium]|nr:cobyrinate a,c-diamide synthase [Bacillota bacterium]
MNCEIPRILIAGTGSGCGKTTVSCAVMKALVDRGLKTAAFKCGPDYIDPMFHTRITGTRSTNLDSFFFDDSTLTGLLAKNGKGCDVSVIEGVMGFYDGLGLVQSKGSSFDVARLTRTPAVLVVDGRGASLSIEAVIAGFLSLEPENTIKGVIINRCSSRVYEAISEDMRNRFGGRVVPLGYMPPMPDVSLESRHLGLVTAAEVEGLSEKLSLLASQAEKTVDLDGLISLAKEAPALRYEPLGLPKHEKVRIAVARDRAFCFYYEDSLDVLRDMGAELVSFSPLEDAALPSAIDGLYLGGGYPELYAERLSANKAMLSSVREAVKGGLPTIAECGGFMYLTEEIEGFPMAGVLPGKCFDNKKLTRFGYVTLTAQQDNMLCRAGETIRGHEFHRWEAENTGSGFTAEKSGGKSWDCVFTGDTLYAGFPHFHFLSNTGFAEGFYGACLTEKKRHDREY